MCSVTFSDGSGCTRDIAYSRYGGICRACDQWSKRNGGVSPQGRHNGFKARSRCTICGAPAHSHGLCGVHVLRLQRSGDPLRTTRVPDSGKDTFYVVRGEGVVKFGITSGVSWRMRAHARDGLTEQLRLLSGMPDGAAKWLEGQCKLVLADHGALPVRGREYFGSEWTELVTDVVDRLS